MTKEELLKLIDRYLSNDVSPEEGNILIDFFESFQDSQEWDEELLGSKELLEKKLETALKESIQKKKQSIWNSRFSLWHKVAATIVLCLGIAFFLNSRSSDSNKHLSVSERFVENDLAPGADIATLTLADGSVINLNDSARREIILGDGSVIQKNEHGQLVYNLANIQKTDKVAYNTLSTPKGGQYQVVLPDGTIVWLNSETSLRFPTSFVGNERKVDLVGEAYFEVAKDKSKQFKVNARGMEVVALGTEFNVNAYEGDAISSTTLFEGSVSVSKESESVLLKPGQNAKLNKASGTINRGQADLESEIAWKNGYFVFNNEDIKSIMVKLSRWYDADIEYEGNMNNKRFTVIISKRSSISEILEVLESTGIIHFEIEGRRVKVMV